MAEFRESMVYVSVPESQQTVFDQLGKIEGLKKIMEQVFSRVMVDPKLSVLYAGKDVAVLEKKYTYFIAG